MQDDDFSLFTNEMRGVKRIQNDRAETGKPKADRKQVASLRQNATQITESTKVDGLSDLFVIDVGAEDELHWARDGVQEGQMRKLKLGQIGFEGSLDLHGMTVEKARETLWDFLAEAAKFEIRCVRITHGKAARLDGKRPLIKSHVNTWLRQHPQVLGFTSCLPRHGGTGALYVMLRRTMLEGRDE
ncbi:Smr/MutS family protein [Pseudomonas sp. No.21]|jgi:DNA-nicking Smr family endonuclease|uniref:DNA mismatch repair protein MutS n=1 Tax=Pseudomonas tohonis TaxID=2725477 RepID=A0A6J4E307_9PSED|nr:MULTISPECIES: Smr/MutS family protein [Pseudomonas]MDW3713876.1 Smr/MutS family protein [Pseudomonas sp. 2023EL-01195]PZE10141.1 DNA mismatch repair protein MutS [Pseudomonas sp. 57B-090624]UXY55023.1 Smr/MutS family protein [Pseudomonas tohonis]BCG24127.1 DNA mismatch repair protein MutS [Pseudomonas tohonis]GJN49226.1 DNA mismatch repair protein MutS [Pseudomonas tohonis]